MGGERRRIWVGLASAAFVAGCFQPVNEDADAWRADAGPPESCERRLLTFPAGKRSQWFDSMFTGYSVARTILNIMRTGDTLWIDGVEGPVDRHSLEVFDFAREVAFTSWAPDWRWTLMETGTVVLTRVGSGPRPTYPVRVELEERASSGALVTATSLVLPEHDALPSIDRKPFRPICIHRPGRARVCLLGDYYFEYWKDTQLPGHAYVMVDDQPLRQVEALQRDFVWLSDSRSAADTAWFIGTVAQREGVTRGLFSFSSTSERVVYVRDLSTFLGCRFGSGVEVLCLSADGLRVMRLDPRTPYFEQTVADLPVRALSLRAWSSRDLLAIETGVEPNRRLLLVRNGKIAQDVPFETSLAVGEVGPQRLGMVGGEGDGGVFFQALCGGDGGL
jgi:hypothetical protein